MQTKDPVEQSNRQKLPSDAASSDMSWHPSGPLTNSFIPTTSSTSHDAFRLSSRESGTLADENLVSNDNLFGVQGLTKALLTECTKAYFKYQAPCQPVLHAEVFSARYSLFFAHFEQMGEMKAYWELPPEEATSVDRPLSLLLILAVGCVGAALLEPPIAEFVSKAKFALQDRLALRFQQEIEEHDLLSRLQHEGMDVIEACYVLSDPSLEIFGDTLPSKWAIDWSLVGEMDKKQRDLLRLRPTSPEGIIRMIFKMSINLNAVERQDTPSTDKRLWDWNGIFVDNREAFRRCRIFWAAFMQDAFRSMGERRSVLIGDNDYDHDPPRFVPLQNGMYEALFWHVPASKDGSSSTRQQDARSNVNPPLFAQFDACQLEEMLRLSFLVRTVSIHFVSPRSKGKGILVTDVDRAMDALQTWYQQRPGIVTWEVQSEPLLSALAQGMTASSNARAMRNSVRALFLDFIYHSQVLAVWGSVETFGIRETSIEDDALTQFLRSSSQLHASDTDTSKSGSDFAITGRHSNSLTSSTWQSPTSYAELSEAHTNHSQSLCKAAKAKLDRIAVESFLHMAKISKEGAQLGLVRASRRIFSNNIGGYILWGCGLAHKLKAATTATTEGQGPSVLLPTVPPGYPQTEYIFDRIEELIYAVGQIDSLETAQDRVKQFKDLLAVTRANASSNLAQQTGHMVNDDTNSVSHAPFRYIFTKGQLNARYMENLSKHYEAAERQNERLAMIHAQDRDVDVVFQLALAAYSSAVDFPFSEDGSPQTIDRRHTPEWNGGFQDQMLDLSFESMAGMDTDLLHQYLQTSTFGQVSVGPFTEPRTHQPAFTSFSDNNAGAYVEPGHNFY